MIRIAPDEGSNGNSGQKEEPSADSGSSYTDTTSPIYLVTIGSEKYRFDSENKIVYVRVACGIGLPTDRCEVLFATMEHYDFKKGDSIKVELGYHDTLKPVFNGIIEDIECVLSTIKISALGSAVSLLRLRLNRVYLNQTAGKIVSNITKEASLKVKTASDGINLPMYVIDEATNAYEHILKLADHCNFDVYITVDKELVFKEAGGGKNHKLQYGKDIICIKALDSSPLFEGTRVYGESPSSIRGSDTSHWLTKQAVKGEAGSNAVLSIDDPVIKDKKTAETVAKAITSKLGYTFFVDVETVGKPEIRLGDTITLEAVPMQELGGQLEVRGIEHYLSKTKGFTTILTCLRRKSA